MENKLSFNVSDLADGIFIPENHKGLILSKEYGGGIVLNDHNPPRVVFWGNFLDLNERRKITVNSWGGHNGWSGWVEFVKADRGYIVRKYVAPQEKWIIWNPTSDKPVTATYTSEAQAITVAECMAKENPGETFHIAKITGGRKAEFTMKNL